MSQKRFTNPKRKSLALQAIHRNRNVNKARLDEVADGFETSDEKQALVTEVKENGLMLPEVSVSRKLQILNERAPDGVHYRLQNGVIVEKRMPSKKHAINLDIEEMRASGNMDF